MAALALAEIQGYRTRNGHDAKKPVSAAAYILRSLKHPAEEELLRAIYGSSFFLIAAYAPIEERRKNLAREIARSRHGMRQAEALARSDTLIQRDDHEQDRSHGQLVRDTFPRADVFVAVHRPDETVEQMQRFVDLVFGHPFHTPTQDEFAMFQARAGALRSADLSRQIGAAIATGHGSVVALGTNEVPRAGGGQYWSGDRPDHRDFQLGEDESLRIRSSMLAEILLRMEAEGWLQMEVGTRVKRDVDREVGVLLPLLRETTMMSVGEFGRTVHAEMAALMDAARRGVPVQGSTLFSTTFPCHNCTKHIVAAGIRRVVYIEPFPKSRAAELHDDSIVVDPSGQVEGKVNFEPFVGIAPRRYLELFTMQRRENPDGSVVRFTRAAAAPRVSATRGYVETEDVAVVELWKRLKQAGMRLHTPEGRRRGTVRR